MSLPSLVELVEFHGKGMDIEVWPYGDGGGLPDEAGIPQPARADDVSHDAKRALRRIAGAQQRCGCLLIGPSFVGQQLFIGRHTKSDSLQPRRTGILMPDGDASYDFFFAGFVVPSDFGSDLFLGEA